MTKCFEWEYLWKESSKVSFFFLTKSPAEVVDDLTVTLRCRGPSEEPRDVDDLVDHLVGNKLNDRPGPEVEGHWEGKPPVGKVVPDHAVPAARQAGGQGAHHLPGGGGDQVVRGGRSQLVSQQQLLPLPPASHLTRLAHDEFHSMVTLSYPELHQTTHRPNDHACQYQGKRTGPSGLVVVWPPPPNYWPSSSSRVTWDTWWHLLAPRTGIVQTHPPTVVINRHWKKQWST